MVQPFFAATRRSSSFWIAALPTQGVQHRPPYWTIASSLYKACAAPDDTQAGMRASRDARGLGGHDLAARDGRQNGGCHLPEILGRVQRRQINPEALCRVDGSERRRQELHGEGPQQTRLAVAPATRGAGRAASQIPSGACPILRAGC